MNKINLNWNLEKYFYKSLEDEKLNKDIQQFTEKAEKFIKKYKWKIKNFTKTKQLLEFYKDEEDLPIEIEKVFHYLFYLQSLNSQDQKVIKKLLEVENLYNQTMEKLIFVDEEFKILLEKFTDLKKLDKKNLTELDKAILELITTNDEKLEKTKLKELLPYKYLIIHKIKTLKHILSPKEEELLTKFSTIDSQIENLYDEFHNWLTFEITLNWKRQKLTEEEVRSLRLHKDEKIRQKAYKSLRKVYSSREVKVTLSNLYSTFVKNWVLNVKIRKYSNVMEPRNVSEDMENEVVDMLMNEVIKNYNLFQKYVELKAKLLNKKLPLAVWNILAPVWDLDKKVSINEAIDIHLKVMKSFDDDFYKYSINLLENGRVDFLPKVWKRWWAFASYTKFQESFVLLNFTEKLNDVFTLTHEFWHAIHWWLSQIQPRQVYNSWLSLAETASIFNEMLLSEYLLNSKDLTKEEKIYLLESKLSDIFATIFRQIQYVDFEKQVHNLIYNNEQLTYEDYCKLRRSTQEKMSGKLIKYDVKPEEENWWSMIPHIFHTPFYCYSYAFGNILVFSLFNKYKKEWKKFVKDYKKILSFWWRIPPKQLLEKFGINILSQQFYQNAFNQIKSMLTELENLINKQ